MRIYKVLWFDDQHEEFEIDKEKAIIENIKLIGYSNSKEGIPELRHNYKDYDAIILDGLFFKEKGQKGTDIDQTAFGEVAKVLNELKAKSIILPWFIYSGQPSFVKDKNDLLEVLKDKTFANGKVFDKNRDEDFIELMNEIKTASDLNPIRKIKVTNPEAFSPFDLNIIDKSYEPILIEIITALENEDYAKKNLNVQRDLLEAIYKTLNAPIPCLHNSFFDNTRNNKPNLEWCTRFMEDRDVNGHKLNKAVPQSIKSAFRKLKESTSEYSHLSEEAILKLPFLSNTFLLMEILEWFPGFVKTNYPNYI
ncbi:hypothetical protein [Flavobacterium sp. SLB02]|uniref:hypothetical protein n=1 Tax=Flavobacterium sp. SLB02 TaxID=2665645 RepID=UPI0012A9F476|nr:hypothetical protein [Flavobacterium sp. SLB02]QGK73214.1 hypothetical protein GIY83_03785 [Flavobacterium sp. SLB02]